MKKAFKKYGMKKICPPVTFLFEKCSLLTL